MCSVCFIAISQNRSSVFTLAQVIIVPVLWQVLCFIVFFLCFYLLYCLVSVCFWFSLFFFLFIYFCSFVRVVCLFCIKFCGHTCPLLFTIGLYVSCLHSQLRVCDCLFFFFFLLFFGVYIRSAVRLFVCA